MTTTSTNRPGPAPSLLAIAPFTSLPAAAQRRLEQEASLQRFDEGQILSNAETVGNRVLVLLEGEARLLGQRDGRPFMLERLGPGELIGLVSLLRAEGCEAVSAATPVLAAAIPDGVVVELLLQYPELRRWCAEQIWTAELHALLQRQDSAHAGADAFEPNAWRQRLQQLRAPPRGGGPPTPAWGFRLGMGAKPGGWRVPMCPGSPSAVV